MTAMDFCRRKQAKKLQLAKHHLLCCSCPSLQSLIQSQSAVGEVLLALSLCSNKHNGSLSRIFRIPCCLPGRTWKIFRIWACCDGSQVLGLATESPTLINRLWIYLRIHAISIKRHVRKCSILRNYLQTNFVVNNRDNPLSHGLQWIKSPSSTDYFINAYC